ncbi:MAG TPA: NAD(P)H-hydrate dehydratase, partial [Chitinophagales bacterium]|nr:NAD(P)H-hydrate dehydratase [Chitinophagales bacterium]
FKEEKIIPIAQKILSANQIREADAYTIKNVPIASIDLMERAAKKWTALFLKDYPDKKQTKYIFCGPGNNGGDGLAIARLLLHEKHAVNVFILHSSQYSADFQLNLQRLKHYKCILSANDFPKLDKEDIVIDALYGSGLNKPINGLSAALINYLNEQESSIISVDIPSGLYTEKQSGMPIIQAQKTYTFQFPKLSFLLPASGNTVGNFKVADIGLHPDFISKINTPYFYTNKKEIKALLKTRNKFSHKGTYGHALLVAGSHGKMGAATLCAKAVMRSGAGLLTAHIPGCGYSILQTALPEAMCICDDNNMHISGIPIQMTYAAVAIGPGLGTHQDTASALKSFLQANKTPCVIDADALNLIAQHKAMLKLLPENCILTPHPKEFERLTGTWTDDFDRLQKLQSFSKKHKVITLLKGAHTAIADVSGNVYFNSTGNPGMATAGSGDVLTGIICGLLAQGYSALESSILGVFLHGSAADLALKKQSEESLIASDIIKNLGRAFKHLKK